MRMNLDEVEIRILGALLEKELSTPENYPLSLNALVSACNQKSNRDPVLNLGEAELARGLESLGARGLARLTTTGGRVARYRHSVAEKLGLAPAARALLAELMLRGPQTAAELRGRAGRMAELGDAAAVELVLNELRQTGPPLVALLPREPGRKEQRYAQLFAGMPELPEAEPEQDESPETGGPAAASAVSARRAESLPVPGAGRLQRLELEVGELRQDVAALRREVEELIDSFR